MGTKRFFVAIYLCICTTACAINQEQRDLLNQGRHLYNRGRYADAAGFFRTTAEIKDMPVARYYLACCRIKLGEYDEAKETLAKVIAADEDSDLGDLAEETLARLEKAEGTLKKNRPWYARVGFGIGADSNVPVLGDNTAPPAGAEDESDSRHTIFVSGGFRPLKGNRSELWIDGNGSMSVQSELSDYDTDIYDLAVRWQYRVSNRFRAAVVGGYESASVGGESYSDTPYFAPSLAYQGTWCKTTFEASLELPDHKYAVSDPALNRDGDITSLSLTQDVTIPNTRCAVRGRIQQSTVDADGSDYEHDSLRAGITVWHPFVCKSRINCGITVARNEYANPNSQSLSGEARDDTQIRLSAGLTRRFMRFFSLFGMVKHIDNDSNIATFEYSRTIAGAGITLDF